MGIKKSTYQGGRIMKELIKKHIIIFDIIIINIFAVLASAIQYIGMKNAKGISYGDNFYRDSLKYKDFISYNHVSYVAGFILFAISLTLVTIHVFHNRKSIAEKTTTGAFLTVTGFTIMINNLLYLDKFTANIYQKNITSNSMHNVTLYIWPLVTLIVFIIALTIIRTTVETDREAEKMYYVSSGRGAYNMMIGNNNEYIDEYHYDVIVKL